MTLEAKGVFASASVLVGGITLQSIVPALVEHPRAAVSRRPPARAS